MSDFVRTVTGDMPAGTIGPVVIHEHLLFDISPPGADWTLANDITLRNRWQTDYLSNENPANTRQNDVDIAAAELSAFRTDGGGLLVDQSVIGLGRNPLGQVQASLAADVLVVAATGTYSAPYLSADLQAASVESLAARFKKEIESGMDETEIRAGLIGEIGCSWPLAAVENRALQAAAIAQSETGVAVSVHPGRHRDACGQILDILEVSGADLSRVILCHMDRTYPDGDGVEPLLDRGAVVEWDFFGVEQSHYWMGKVELPNDLQRLRMISALADKGHGDRIVVSHDICTKTRMAHWGGHGYGHILRNIPALMHRLEIADELANALLRLNPLRLLTLKETMV